MRPCIGACTHPRVKTGKHSHLPAADLRRIRPEQHLIECTYAAGNYTEAEKPAHSMLHRNRIHLGETHPITLYTGDMIGHTLCCLGRYEEAETVQRRVLAATIIVSGERDGATAWRMSSLANTLGKQRKFEEAVRLAQDSVAILRSNGATDGPNGPNGAIGADGAYGAGEPRSTDEMYR